MFVPGLGSWTGWAAGRMEVSRRHVPVHVWWEGAGQRVAEPGDSLHLESGRQGVRGTWSEEFVTFMTFIQFFLFTLMVSWDLALLSFLGLSLQEIQAPSHYPNLAPNLAPVRPRASPSQAAPITASLRTGAIRSLGPCHRGPAFPHRTEGPM